MKVKTIGDIANIVSGYAWKSREFKEKTVKGLPVIRIQNLNNTVDTYKYWEQEYDERFLVHKNDILVSLSGNVKVDLWKGPIGLLNQRIIKILPKKNIDKEWLYFLVKSIIQDIAGLSKKSIIDNISVRDFKNIGVDVPDLERQKEIVNVLNKANLLIKKRKQQVEALSSLKQSIFLDMFGDPVTNKKGFNKKQLVNLCDEIIGGGTPSKRHPEYYIGNIPWVTPKDMKREFIETTIDYINRQAIKNSSAKQIPENSVLMVIRSGILKHTLPVAINKGEVAINQDMKAFIPKKTILTPEYLLYSLKCFAPVLLSQVRSVTAHNLEFNKVKNLEIPVPNIKQQISFSKKVKQIESMIISLNQQLTRFEELKKSMTQKAFNGKLFQNESTKLTT